MPQLGGATKPPHIHLLKTRLDHGPIRGVDCFEDGEWLVVRGIRDYWVVSDVEPDEGVVPEENSQGHERAEDENYEGLQGGWFPDVARQNGGACEFSFAPGEEAQMEDGDMRRMYRYGSCQPTTGASLLGNSDLACDVRCR